MAEKGKTKVTWIKLETESLKSEKNLKKIKKALYFFPQIRDQIYDEEKNTVTIKVVCCSPEKIMDKLCSKGHGAIKRLNTIDMSKPKPPNQDPKKEPESTTAQTGPMGMHNGPLCVWTQPNWYLERPVYDSYRGGPPPSYFYVQEESSFCCIS